MLVLWIPAPIGLAGKACAATTSGARAPTCVAACAGMTSGGLPAALRAQSKRQCWPRLIPAKHAPGLERERAARNALPRWVGRLRRARDAVVEQGAAGVG